MKKHIKSLLPICLLIGLLACRNANRGGDDTSKIIDSLSDTTKRAEEINAALDLKDDAKIFALSAATGGMMEVEAANLALKKSKEKAVRDFAGRMLKDHSIANKELKSIAAAKGLQLPQTLVAELSKHLEMLNTLADRAFDVQYMKMMINDHKKTVQLFTDGSHLVDPELKAFAAKTLPVIKEHYQTAMEIGKRLNISNANSGDDVLGLSPKEIEKK
jgi:putative membrane protein